MVRAEGADPLLPPYVYYATIGKYKMRIYAYICIWCHRLVIILCDAFWKQMEMAVLGVGLTLKCVFKVLGQGSSWY